MTELQLDALTELVDLRVSKSALSLREMVREEVILTLPKVTIVTQQSVIDMLGERKAKWLVAVTQNFEGKLTGRALLIFPEAKSMELVRALIGGNLELEEMMDLENEALAETGNVLLNACLGSIANSLEQTQRMSLPEVLHGQGADL